MTYFAKYDLITGAFRGGGSCPEFQLADQAGAGIGVIESDADVFVASEVDGQTVITVDVTGVRSFLSNRIDAEAGASRMTYITDVAGQAQTYEKKEVEARDWTDGDEITNPDRFPFMLAEATVRDVPISQVRGEIMDRVALLTPLAALIEAHRINAKLNVAAATTIKDMVAAAVIDWAGLTGWVAINT